MDCKYLNEPLSQSGQGKGNSGIHWTTIGRLDERVIFNREIKEYEIISSDPASTWSICSVRRQTEEDSWKTTMNDVENATVYVCMYVLCATNTVHKAR